LEEVAVEANKSAAGRHGTGHRVVVITGGTAGVGRAAARAFARRGADVAVLARGTDGLEATVRDIEALGARGLGIPTDVADAEAVESAAARVEAELGAIDVWVNNAMTTVFGPVWDISAHDLRRTTEVTYLGTVHGTMAALKRMRPRDSGVIVQVGSLVSYRSIPLASAYSGAKHAALGFTDAVRAELIHENSRIHLTNVLLPAINTPQFRWGRNRIGRRVRPVPPVYQPEVAADAIVWASEHDRREVMLSPQAWLSVWGQRLFPGLLDRIVARMVWDAQLTDEPSGADPDYLDAPVAGDQGARGAFDADARDHAASFDIDRHRGTIGAILATIGVLGLGARLLRALPRIRV
jgi:NAD(P)-dependent dehydrogenase (short-subunit alcohol dehydrogenase family)